MGHSKPSTTESVYMHLFAEDHADEMAALDAMAVQPPAAAPAAGGNVILFRR